MWTIQASLCFVPDIIFVLCESDSQVATHHFSPEQRLCASTSWHHISFIRRIEWIHWVSFTRFLSSLLQSHCQSDRDFHSKICQVLTVEAIFLGTCGVSSTHRKRQFLWKFHHPQSYFKNKFSTGDSLLCVLHIYLTRRLWWQSLFSERRLWFVGSGHISTFTFLTPLANYSDTDWCASHPTENDVTTEHSDGRWIYGCWLPPGGHSGYCS